MINDRSEAVASEHRPLLLAVVLEDVWKPRLPDLRRRSEGGGHAAGY